MADSAAHIPAIYRVVILWIDPLLSLFGGAIPCIFVPDMILDSYIPASISTRNPLHDLLFYQLAGGFIVIFWSQFVLLRYTRDMAMWRLVNAGLLGFDLIFLYGLWCNYSLQGRMDPLAWRVVDWFGVLCTIVVTTVRACIVAGLGFDEAKKNKTE